MPDWIFSSRMRNFVDIELGSDAQNLGATHKVTGEKGKTKGFKGLGRRTF
jgi:hypothetical protein